MEAAKDHKVRLVAIAKNRFNAEEFASKYWRAPAELYFDSAQDGYPFFEVTNGRKQGLGPFIASFLFGGQARKNWEKGDTRIPNDITHLDLFPVMGSVMVVSRTGEVLYHHKERTVGDQPDPLELETAIRKLGGTGAASCECSDSEVPGTFDFTTTIPA